MLKGSLAEGEKAKIEVATSSNLRTSLMEGSK
jgi:hypothetical protein